MKNLLLIAFLLALFSCENVVKENETESEDKVALDVNANSVSLTANRVTYRNEPLFSPTFDSIYYGEEEVITSKSATLLERGEMFTLIADVAAPVRSGDRTLSATHVTVKGNRAYVSYHYNEPNNSPISQDLYEGQVEVLDITDPSKPIILSSATTDVSDFNTMCLDFATDGVNEKLWIGATDYKVGGTFFELDLVNGDLAEGAELKRYRTRGGFSVNGIARASDYLFATAGRTEGGNYIFDASTLESTKVDTFSNAKYVAVTGTNEGDKQVVLKSGNNAQLLVYSIDESHQLLNTIDLGSIQPETGKSGIYVKDDICWVAMGYAGLKAFDITTGELVHSLSITGPAVSNGVSMDDDYIYVANGSGGMYICEAIEGQVELEVLEVYNYGASANYINVGENLIFIANGREGLKILRRSPKGNYNTICDYDENGVPECLVQNEICSSLRANVNVVLPEYQNVITTHPEYFSYPNSIVLKEDAEVYVSFLDEGAGYKNSFGMYTYDVNDAPSTTTDITTKQLIYPNASKKYAGGNLIPGGTVHMVGIFPTGTNIGSYLMANSWVGLDKVEGGIKDGYYTHYSDNHLNKGELQQCLVLYDQECEAIVIAFEDISTTGGDRDFNDCLMTITVEPASAVDVSQFIQIVKE